MRAPTFEEIGARVRSRREEKGLSQADLAKAVGVSRPVITKIEAGGKAINSVELRRIADVLGVSIEDLTRSVNDGGLVDAVSAHVVGAAETHVAIRAGGDDLAFGVDPEAALVEADRGLGRQHQPRRDQYGEDC